jgi:hypothetical protein
MSKIVNLTPAVLRRIIMEEKAQVMKERRASRKSKPKSTTHDMPADMKDAVKKTREVGPSELAGTLAKKVKHYENLQREAADLVRRLSEINEARQELRSDILEEI